MEFSLFAHVFARTRLAFIAIAVFAGAFALYLSNGTSVVSYDNAPNSLLAFNLLENQRLDFDRFRGGYFNALGGGYAFVEAPNGHLTSMFPVGAAIVTLPLYALLELTRGDGAHTEPIESPAFEPARRQYEKIVAAAVAALSVALFLLCACEIENAVQSAIATGVYALATSIWSTASQGLWQHGPLNALLLALVYACFRAGRAREPARVAGWLVAAGLCAGLLPVVRPTAALFTLAATIFAVRTFDRRSAWFFTAAIAGVAPGVVWNAYFFHSLLGGYAPNAAAYGFAPYPVLAAFAALLVSPSRGLFVFSPVLAFSIAGAVVAWRTRDRNARLLVFLAVASVALVAQYACFRYWWSGFAYGSRFLCDVSGVAALLLAYVIPPHPITFARRNAGAAAAAIAFAVTFAVSAGVQFAGVNSGAAGSDWNAIPVSIDVEPQRVWPIADNQIERNVRAAADRLFAWNLAGSPAYDRGVAARVTALSPSLVHAIAGEQIVARAEVHNDGRSRLYGYDSGVYVGQARVRVRTFDAGNRSMADQYLYVRGSPLAGERASAVGLLALPAAPGTYRLEFTPILVGSDDAAGPAFRVVFSAP